MERFGEIIYSRQNRAIVELCKLSDRKRREESRAFRFDGIKLLEEAIGNDVELSSVFLRADRADLIWARLAQRFGESVFDRMGTVRVLAEDVFDKISEEKSPEGVISVAKYIDKSKKFVTIYNSADFSAPEKERIVLLESVRDPSNLGAIIRSAAAFGIDRLIISADCADIYHPKTVRASMGTLFAQRIDRVTDLESAIRCLRQSGRRVFAATLSEDAVVLGQSALRSGDCVVIGNEGHGLSDATVAACDHSIFIPMTARAESLNAAVAASVLMWEFSKILSDSEQ